MKQVLKFMTVGPGFIVLVSLIKLVQSAFEYMQRT